MEGPNLIRYILETFRNPTFSEITYGWISKIFMVDGGHMWVPPKKRLGTRSSACKLSRKANFWLKFRIFFRKMLRFLQKRAEISTPTIWREF